MTVSEAAKQKLVKVKLNQAHTHQGQEHKTGATIEVLPHTASYIEKHKIGSRI
jgi:hypothetical protein